MKSKMSSWEKVPTHTPAGRPMARGVPQPLYEGAPEAWWEEEAAKHGLTVAGLKAQVTLADSIMEELLAAEGIREAERPFLMNDHRLPGHVHRATYGSDGCHICDEILLTELARRAK